MTDYVTLANVLTDLGWIDPPHPRFVRWVKLVSNANRALRRRLFREALRARHTAH